MDRKIIKQRELTDWYTTYSQTTGPVIHAVVGGRYVLREDRWDDGSVTFSLYHTRPDGTTINEMINRSVAYTMLAAHPPRDPPKPPSGEPTTEKATVNRALRYFLSCIRRP